MRLLAERGFRGTTVGDIEAAAGLAPRAGGMYKHFRDKRALLVAAVERMIEETDAMRRRLAESPPPAASAPVPRAEALRAELALAGGWLLAELARSEHLTRVLDRDGDLFPELRDRVRERFSDTGHREAVELVRRWTGRQADAAVEGAALMLVGGLVNYRRTVWMLGAPPLGIPEERLLAGWTEACARLLEGLIEPR
jgi:AcrR family transcriptional regulator